MPTDEEEDADRIDALRSALELPFYLYEGPSFDDGSWFEACSRGLRGERIEEDQYSGEHYWLAQLRRHRWRVAQLQRRDGLLHEKSYREQLVSQLLLQVDASRALRTGSLSTVRPGAPR